MASDVYRGTLVGRETYLYYNSATNATPTWVEISRARNVQHNHARGIKDVNYHGSSHTVGVPGYRSFSGSFEYVKSTIDLTDSVLSALETHRDNGTVVELIHLNGPADSGSHTGWRAPVLLGEFSETANGEDEVVVTIPFQLADAYDASDAQILPSSFTGTA